MSNWPAKMEVTAAQFDSLEADALVEQIGPWMLGAFESGAPEAPKSIRFGGSAYWISADVGNGGIDQYFFNSAYGISCAAEALSSLGRQEAAAILSHAIDQLPNPTMIDDIGARRSFLSDESSAKLLDELTLPFWKALKEDTFRSDLAKYVRAHRADFAPYFRAVVE